MSYPLKLSRFALMLAILSAASQFAQERSATFAADSNRRATTGAERDSAPHALHDNPRWHGGHGAHPGGNVRVHVGTVLPGDFGQYAVPQYGNHRSRAGYHVVDRANTAPSRMHAPTVPDAETFHSWAIRSFRSRHYREAMRLVKHALIEDERNGNLYFTLSATQIAVMEYEPAADSLGRGLALLDRSAWDHAARNQRRLYANDDYESHLKTLSAFVERNPDATFARFLRGYHAVWLGQEEAARRDLQEAAESTRYADSALGLLDIIEDSTPGEFDFEELPAPMDSATEHSR